MAGYITLDQGIGAVKAETSYGVDIFAAGAPAAADCLPFASLNIAQNIDFLRGDRLTATVADECGAPVPIDTEVTWDTLLLGSGAAGDLPPIDALLKAAGLYPTVVATTSVTYAPEIGNDQSRTPSATFLRYLRDVDADTARRVMARGVRTNATITLTRGQEARIAGTGRGLYNALPTSSSALPSLPTSYAGDQCAWVVNSLVLTVGVTVYPIESMTLETRWTIETLLTGDAGGGTAGRQLLTKPKSGQPFGGSFALVDGAAALTAAIGLWQSGAKATLSAVLTKGSRVITIGAGAIQLLPAQADQAPRFPVEYQCVRADGATGAGHLTIAFT
jgi:hypothetical protein